MDGPISLEKQDTRDCGEDRALASCDFGKIFNDAFDQLRQAYERWNDFAATQGAGFQARYGVVDGVEPKAKVPLRPKSDRKV
jgi:hypothetical protein